MFLFRIMLQKYKQINEYHTPICGFFACCKKCSMQKYKFAAKIKIYAYFCNKKRPSPVFLLKRNINN